MRGWLGISGFRTQGKEENGEISGEEIEGSGRNDGNEDIEMRKIEFFDFICVIVLEVIFDGIGWASRLITLCYNNKDDQIMIGINRLISCKRNTFDLYSLPLIIPIKLYSITFLHFITFKSIRHNHLLYIIM